MYYAHRPGDLSIIDKSEWQKLEEHNRNVGNLSKYYLKDLSEEIQSIGYIAGYYHDIGKYSNEFQNKLINLSNIRVDHSTAGGKELISKNFIAGLSILAHHGGLFDLDKLKTRLSKEIPNYLSYRDYQERLEVPDLSFLDRFKKDKNRDFHIQNYIRFILSSLVDSDFIDTENYMNIERSDTRKVNFDSFESLKKKLDNYIESKFDKSADINSLNLLRNKLRIKCIESANLDNNIYSLTAPTGLGKTVSSMAFSLNKAIKEGHRRIIYCIPYNNIIIQIAEEFRKIFGSINVLEHHSSKIYSDSEFDKLLATENWDYPIILTTNVQFFESLFSAKTSKLRKLHNIINSVIVFDEAQMIPIHVLKPCLKMIKDLSDLFSCSILLSSATQPDYSMIDDLDIVPYSITNKLFDKYKLELKRVNYEYLGLIEYENLLSEIKKYNQVLVVVNSRNIAKSIFRGLKDFSGNTIYLTNSLTLVHKRYLLNQIKFRLSNSLPCRVIATSLIEAGVDLDFPVGFRELTGLDSIIQTGGRINREGRRLTKGSNLFVFELEKDNSLSKESVNVSIARKLIEKLGINNDEMVNRYFEILFNFSADKLDEFHILRYNYQTEKSLSETYSFKTIENRFKLIEDNDFSIFIPFIPEYIKLDKGEKHPKHLLNIIKSFDCKITKILRRQLSKFSVQVNYKVGEDLKENRLIELVNGIWILKDLERYNKFTGL